MSSRSVTWRRVGVSAVALATVAAGSPLLLSSAAHAVPATGFTISQEDGRTSAAAGTCTAFVLTPRNVLNTDEVDAATVTVRIAENPASNTQDVDFCTVEEGEPFAALPGYDNADQIGGASPGPSTAETYAAGPSITPPISGGTGPSGSPGNPDVASGNEPATFANNTAGRNNNNPSGVDTAIFRVTRPIRFGVVALVPGPVAIDAFVDPNANREQNSGENTVAPVRALTVTAGGRQGSVEAADAVKRVELVDPPDRDEESVATQGSGGSAATHDLEVSLFNSNGDRVSGVRPVLRALSGPNAPSAFAPNGTVTEARCEQVFGQAFATPCTYSATQTGRDLLVAYVDQSGGTSRQDSAEPADTVSALTLPPTNTTATAARYIDLRPESASVPAGQRQTFTATVTDVAGAPVQNVQVRFDESGAGAFVSPSTQAATSTVTMTSDNLGQAAVQFASSSTETGSNTITSTITTANSQCTAQASGSTPAGRCSDTSAVTLTAPTASPTPSASASPSRSATPTPSTSATGSPSPSSTASTGCTTPASVSLDATTITATGGATATVRGTANSVVDLFAYSRPSTTYRLVRTGNVGSDGAESYRITPPTNTRLYAQQRGCSPSASIVLNVRTQISMNVVRNGTRNYTFSGSAIPARPNGLIVSLYRVESNGRQILTAQTRANANVGQAGYDSTRPAGSYTIRRQFTGSGRFGFVVRTGQDLQNAPGSSNVRSLLVF